MATLDKAGLLARKTLRRQLVDLGDAQVWMREFSVAELAALRQKYQGTEGEPGGVPRSNLSILASALQNEDGTPMFEEQEIGEAAEVLAAGSSVTVAKLMAAMDELNGLGEGALKEALGKSVASPGAASS